MRAPVSWLRELVDIPAQDDGRAIAERLIRAGLEVETVELIGAGVQGDLVVGYVVELEELTEFKKPIRWCQVDVGPAHGGVRGVICGARNFAAGDLVVVALPGTVLPGGFEIAARSTYGKVSNGMICSERELGLGENHDGIMVLPSGSAEPGADAKPIVGVGEEVLDIAVTPDRGYALSMRGLARELAISYQVPFDDPGLAVVDLPAPAADAAPALCGSEDLTACALFTLRTIVGFDPSASSPAWMQRRLVACGMRPVSLAVDVTNYVMIELGQPLHAFDLAKLQGPVRAGRAKSGETLETLDHVSRTLSSDDLVIKDDRGVIGLAGTMGGLETEIDDSTTSIALEAAHFSPDVVARMARRHRLSSEASRRFERGVDRVLAPYASARAAALLLEWGGGHYVGLTAIEAPYAATSIPIQPTLPGDVAGMPIDGADVAATLTSIGCEVALGDDLLTVAVPPWRSDLTDPADLVEEVIRLVGYDQLPSTVPTAAIGRGLTPHQRMRRRIGTALAARGGIEVLCYPFVGDAELDGMRVPRGDTKRSAVRLANPLSEEQPYLRSSLLPGLLATARRNCGRGNVDSMVFEIGTVVRGRIGKAIDKPRVDERPSAHQWQEIESLLPAQPAMLAAVLTGEATPAGWWGPSRVQDWSDAVAVAETVADSLGVVLDRRRGADPSFHPGRCVDLLIDSVVVGVAGELHPSVLEALGLPARTCAVELDLDACLGAALAVRPAPEVSGHPVAKEDLALVVPDDVPVAAVEQALREGAGSLLESLRLFDVYQGPQVPPGHRSLAFALRLRAPDRTLAAAETAAVRASALAAAADSCGAVLR